METFVHARFKNERDAAAAVQALVDAHFEPAEISALMRVGDEVEDVSPRHKSSMARGAVLGSTLGVIGGALAATGVGLVAAGPLLAAAEGALLGGIAGGAAGALGGLSRWKDELELPEHGPTDMILVGVSTHAGRIDSACEALATANPECIHVASKDEACREVATGISTAPAAVPASSAQGR